MITALALASCALLVALYGSFGQGLFGLGSNPAEVDGSPPRTAGSEPWNAKGRREALNGNRGTSDAEIQTTAPAEGTPDGAAGRPATELARWHTDEAVARPGTGAPTRGESADRLASAPHLGGSPRPTQVRSESTSGRLAPSLVAREESPVGHQFAPSAQEYASTAPMSNPAASSLEQSGAVPSAEIHHGAADRVLRRSAAEPIPLLDELPASVQRTLPSLHVSVHAYDEVRENRFVLINLNRYREGEHTKEGPLIEAITADGLILRYQGERFRLTR